MATRKTDESIVKGGFRPGRLEACTTPEQKNPSLGAAVREHEAMTLSGRDQNVFIGSLLKAPAPGARLRKAARRYKKRSGIT